MQNNGVRYGIIISLVYIIINFGLYFISPEMIFNGWFGFFSFFGFFIVGISLAVSKEKQDNKGFIEFKEAFKTALIVISILAVSANLYAYLLLNFIDTGLYEIQKEKSIEIMAKILSPDMMDEFVDNLKEEDFLMTLDKVMMGIAGYIIFGSIIGAIISSIMKNPKPDHMKKDIALDAEF